MNLYRTQRVDANWLAITAAALLIGAAPVASALEGGQYQNQAKVDIARARDIAAKTFPGRLLGEELEKGKRGSGLYYSFDIAGTKEHHEVWIDAKTGEVLRNAK